MRQQESTVAVLRRLLLGVLLFGLAGTATELLLISHDKDICKLIPIVAIALAVLLSLGLATTRRTPPPVLMRLFQGMMVLLILTGGAGMVLHHRANMEFKLEMDPTLGGLALFWSVVRA